MKGASAQSFCQGVRVMAHIDLAHAGMKPPAVVRYEIARDRSRAKQFLVAAIISSTMILVIAALFLDLVL